LKSAAKPTTLRRADGPGLDVAAPAITAPIIGANSVEQLNELLASLEVNLSPEDVQAIDQASEWKSQE
jgi:aryl-alcohol dehydrogenase-like predicted oxidoreductase